MAEAHQCNFSALKFEISSAWLANKMQIGKTPRDRKRNWHHVAFVRIENFFFEIGGILWKPIHMLLSAEAHFPPPLYSPPELNEVSQWNGRKTCIKSYEVKFTFMFPGVQFYPMFVSFRYIWKNGWIGLLREGAMHLGRDNKYHSPLFCNFPILFHSFYFTSLQSEKPGPAFNLFAPLNGFVSSQAPNEKNTEVGKI